MGKAKGSSSSSDLKTDGRGEAFDPALISLFASSAGPVQSTQKPYFPKRSSDQTSIHRDPESGYSNFEAPVGASKQANPEVFSAAASDQDIVEVGSETSNRLQRKRKRKFDDTNDNHIESQYLRRFNRLSAQEEISHQRTRDGEAHSPAHEGSQSPTLGIDNSNPANSKNRVASPLPQHEALSLSNPQLDLEKASRTVFLGNVSTIAIKSNTARKTLIDHLEYHMSGPSTQVDTYKVQSIRFRSTAFSNNGLPKKAAYVKKELMDSTTKSTNAYVVYSTQSAAREAVVKLNGTVVFDRHLRVDSVAHPTQIDHRRCVFVGNLGFVDDESVINAAKDEDNNRRPRKAREPADAEEGLWRQFSKAGVVENVRVIRDKMTRVGKGFAYVQFQDVNSVERALLFDGKKFPPMLPRVLRVSRAKRSLANASRTTRSLPSKPEVSGPSGIYQPKVSSKSMSLSGRAKKLLGNAGAANFSKSPSAFAANASIPAEKMVFEGHRASSMQGMRKIRLAKKQGKPQTRSSRRGAAFKASGKKNSTRS